MFYLLVSWVDLIYLDDNKETIRFCKSTCKGKSKEKIQQKWKKQKQKQKQKTLNLPATLIRLRIDSLWGESFLISTIFRASESSEGLIIEYTTVKT